MAVITRPSTVQVGVAGGALSYVLPIGASGQPTQLVVTDAAGNVVAKITEAGVAAPKFDVGLDTTPAATLDEEGIEGLGEIAPTAFNIPVATAATIEAMSPAAGKRLLYMASDTFALYYWTGTLWKKSAAFEDAIP
jgi:hypothetical protein